MASRSSRASASSAAARALATTASASARLSTRGVDRPFGFAFPLAPGAPFDGELLFEPGDVVSGPVAVLLGSAPRLVEGRELELAGLGVVVGLLLEPLAVEGRAHDAQAEQPPVGPGGVQHRGEQGQVGALRGLVDPPLRVAGVPEGEDPLDLGPVAEPGHGPVPEPGVDVEGSAQLLAGRARGETLLPEAGQGSQHGREVDGVEVSQHVGGGVEERDQQQFGDGERPGGLEHGVVADGHAYTPALVRSVCEELRVSTAGDGDVVDLTERAQQVVDSSGIGEGLCTVFVAHSTCGVTTIECEPGCNADFNAVLEDAGAAGPAMGAQRP